MFALFSEALAARSEPAPLVQMFDLTIARADVSAGVDAALWKTAGRAGPMIEQTIIQKPCAARFNMHSPHYTTGSTRCFLLKAAFTGTLSSHNRRTWRQDLPKALPTRMEHLIRPEVIDVLNDQVGLVGPVVPAGCQKALPQGMQVLEPVGPLGFPLV
jgi:hypothetical protein